ncbi:MAG: class I SAM-dependent RNA methyltransferase [Bacteroidetes bacterium]|nr:class I SAM-dependent RNA methyltransferase [Bacteroidota bacterium]
MVAKTMVGLEDVLAKELMVLGAKDVQAHNRAVSFVGDKGFMYKANYGLRTALSILKPIAKFEVETEKDLYSKIQEIDWTQILTVKQTFMVNTSLNTEVFNHSLYVSQLVKDAIVDQFNEKFKIRPSIDLENPDLVIDIHISKTTCSVSLNSSGVSLYKRGYRKNQTEAILNEVLAAGIVMLSGWDKRSPLIDFMCGSGTILIEAALLANNIPPGYFRKSFSFMNWTDFDAELFELIKESAIKRIKEEQQSMFGYDILNEAIVKAKENAESAMVDDIMKFTKADFRTIEPEVKRGVIILNPPYGERIQTEEDINVFYKEIGNTLKQKFKGFEAWIFTGNGDAAKSIGLQTSRKLRLFNGPIECRLLKYEMYEGSRKLNKIKN